MNKSQLVEAVALDANISKVDARKAVDAIIRVTVHSSGRVSALPSPGSGHSACSRNPHVWAAIRARAPR